MTDAVKLTLVYLLVKTSIYSLSSELYSACENMNGRKLFFFLNGRKLYGRKILFIKDF